MTTKVFVALAILGGIACGSASMTSQAAASPVPSPSSAATPPDAVDAPAPPAPAPPSEVLYLMDGSVLHGTTVISTSGVLVFKTAVGTLNVPMTAISRIEFGQIATTAGTKVGAETTDAAKGETTDIATKAGAASVDAAPLAQPGPAQRTPSGTGRASSALFAAVGFHQYAGYHWKGNDPAAYSSIAFEVGGRTSVFVRAALRVDGAFTLGYYGGGHCFPDSASTCVTNEFTNFYVDIGPRTTWELPEHLFVYGQGGVGLYYSRFDFRVSQADPNYPEGGHGESTRFTPSADLLVGLGYSLDRYAVFASIKATWADGTFPAHAGSGGFVALRNPIGMGGETTFLGMEARF